jgi:hypothetical protein
MELKTFGEVQTSIENFETLQAAAPEAATTATETPVTDASIEAPQETAPTEPAAVVLPEEGTSAIDLSLAGEVAEEPVTAPSAPSFNLDEEIKKVDRKELLKKAGVNDFAIELDEYLAKGGKAADYLNAKAIDYNQVSDEALIKSDLKNQYPTFTPQQIDIMYNRKYGVNELATEEDVEFTALQLKADAHNVRQSKIAEQQKFKIPDTPILQHDEAYEQWKEQQKSQPQLMEQFRSYYDNHEATKTLNESKRVTINLGEGIPPFNFIVDQPKVLTKAMTDGGVIMNKLIATQSGEPDVAKQQKITLFSFNPDKFIQDIFKYGQSMGVRKELVEEGQNAQRPQAKVTDMTTNTKPTVVGTGTYGNRPR